MNPMATDDAVRTAVVQAVRNVQSRFPTAPHVLVQECVNRAFDHLRNAKVTLSLEILIQRSANRAVGDAIRSGDLSR